MKKLYDMYKDCMVRFIMKSNTGDYANGAGFHIGNGYIVTARSVIEQNTIETISRDEFSYEQINVKNTFFPSDPLVDLALLETDFSLRDYQKQEVNTADGSKPTKKAGFIPLGGHLDDWLGDELVLSRVLVMGYPPIPFSRYPVLVAVEGEVNAIIDKYYGPHPHFIISPIPRGGFSGGPVISEYDFLLGVFVESLLEGDKVVETGFASVLSIEPLLVLLHENDIHIDKNPNILDDIADWEPS